MNRFGFIYCVHYHFPKIYIYIYIDNFTMAISIFWFIPTAVMALSTLVVALRRKCRPIKQAEGEGRGLLYDDDSEDDELAGLIIEQPTKLPNYRATEEEEAYPLYNPME